MKGQGETGEDEGTGRDRRGLRDRERQERMKGQGETGEDEGTGED